MFIDEAQITLKAGHGGAGKVSFFPGYKSGPDGGNGGRGGDLIIVGSTDLYDLQNFTKHKLIEAEDGQDGLSNQKTGRDGNNRTVKFPPGTLLSDLETGEEFEITHAGQEIEICRGGIGGKGNAELANSRNTTPMKAQDGRPGQTRILKLTLKLIADFGLIGLPNAGKSSLLNELTRATAKVANYPFTTLEPNLGVLGTHVLADIPGLIEGAAGGKGLGIKFLKHIEKTTILLHCVAADSEDILADYKTVRQELANYNPELLEKPEIILLTKSDLIEPKDLAKKQKTLAKFGQVLTVSIHDWDSLQVLMHQLQR